MHTCHDCQHPIPSGRAVLRSVSLKRVAFCVWCWNARTSTAGRERIAS